MKWCVLQMYKKGPHRLEFDLLYRRFITRIEVTFFEGPIARKHHYIDTSRVIYSLDGKSWTGFLVSAVLEELGQFVLIKPGQFLL